MPSRAKVAYLHLVVRIGVVEGSNEATNRDLQEEIRSAAALPVWFCGRLATYRYIDQDQAIADAMATVERILDHPGATVGTS